MPGPGRQGRLTVGLRPATAADAEGIAHVHRLSRAAYYGTVPDPDDGREQFWGALLAEPERTTYLAERADDVFGFLSTSRTEDQPPLLELTSLYVLPERFGQGVGSALYDAFLRERRPGETGSLEVWAGNRRAVTFYLRRGWTETRRRRPGPQQVDFVTYLLGA